METLKDTPAKLAALAEERFTKTFGEDNTKISTIAPASVILLGDHTHYNDGNIEDNSQLTDRELDWVPISFSLSFMRCVYKHGKL